MQRVPVTESQGRIHTSAATVIVLPEADEVDVSIDPADLRVDVFRSTGPGGQSVNTTDSAVRMTHLPTGIVVSMQDEKSQIQNRARALQVLRARLLKLEQDRVAAEQSEQRRSQVGGGGRSEKIRTYNFKENRVTDHRVKLTLHKLDRVLEGDLDEIVDALIADERRRAPDEWRRSRWPTERARPPGVDDQRPGICAPKRDGSWRSAAGVRRRGPGSGARHRRRAGDIGRGTGHGRAASCRRAPAVRARYLGVSDPGDPRRPAAS